MSGPKVSDDEIWAKRTEKAKRSGVGAWSRQQLASWGVPWPPPKGWRRKLNGGVYRNGAPEDEPGVFEDVVLDVLDELTPVYEPIYIEFEEPITRLVLSSRHDVELALSILEKAGVAVKAAEPVEVLEADDPPWSNSTPPAAGDPSRQDHYEPYNRLQQQHRRGRGKKIRGKMK